MSRIASSSVADNSSLEQKIDIATVSAGGIPISGTANVDVVGNTIGLLLQQINLLLMLHSQLLLLTLLV